MKKTKLERDVEGRRERFERLAQRRVSEILARIRLVGNLSDKRNYEYSEEHVRQIFDAVEAEVKASRARFKNVDTTATDSFRFNIRSK
jgi:hypothetical protein